MNEGVAFKVFGPVKVHHTKGPGGRAITGESIERFWREHRKFEGRFGCYVFAMSAGRGLTPWYVGKTTKTFKKEVFTPHKLNYYTLAMMNYARGKPAFFFVAAPKAKGKRNNSMIREVEKYLINLGITANPDLLNKQDASLPDWGINGVVRGGKGKVAAGVKSFRKMLGIRRG